MAVLVRYGVPQQPGLPPQPGPRLYAPRVTGTLSGPNYAGAAADLGDGSAAGPWASTGNATGSAAGTYATWTVP